MKSLMQCFAVLAAIHMASQSFAADRVVVIPLKKANKAEHVVTVLPEGGDFTDPIAAIESIADASAENPYLVLIGPGRYTLARTLEMQPYVTIAGAGRDATFLAGAVSAADPGAAAALVAGADNATLRDLTIANNAGGGGACAVGLANEYSSPHVYRVAAAATGGTKNYGVYNFLSLPVLTDVEADAVGGSESYGMRNNGSAVTMRGVRAIASGADSNYGVYNSVSSPLMSGVTAIASGGSYSSSYGVYNNLSSPEMTDVTATASGAATNHGVYNTSSSSPAMTRVTAQASGGLLNIGVQNVTSSPVILHSTLDSLNVSGGTTRVMLSSILHGAVIGSGTLICVKVDDGVAAALNGTCQGP